MGQYYKALLKHPDGEREVFCPQTAVYMAVHELDKMPDDYSFGDPKDPTSFVSLMSGIKLTEHSWIGNYFVDGVIDMIYKNPAHVAWVGDYADNKNDFSEMYTKEDYEFTWARDNDKSFYAMPASYKEGFLVNHTKGEILDIAKHIENCTDSQGWCLHPLPLLTAIGNGRGGGDYGRGYINFDKVGIWANDLIEYRKYKPLGYIEVEYHFSEDK